MKMMTGIFVLCGLLTWTGIFSSGGSKAMAGSKQADSQSATRITIGYTPWTGFGALFVAKDKGMFKARGLDVQLQSIEGYGQRKKALAVDQIQAMAAGLNVSVYATAELPLKFIWAFGTSDGAEGLVVTPEINCVADLRGKRVAYQSGAVTELFLAALLDKAGLKESDIMRVDMKTVQAVAAFMEGEVDAAVVWEPHLSKVVQADGKILATSKDTPGLVADVLVLKAEYVKANPEAVEKIVAALAEATD